MASAMEISRGKSEVLNHQYVRTSWICVYIYMGWPSDTLPHSYGKWMYTMVIDHSYVKLPVGILKNI